ncbi:MAG: 16S rRNA (cytidine(1402)-2'-O)-methyltransferase [Flavobacteriales bacterium]
MSQSKLIIVPTPIGNLKDITLRALEVLKDCDFILAEDTRTSLRLLQHYEIEKKLYPFHLNNEHSVLKKVADEIESGKTAALVSDAGTPGISDPGFLLVRECVARGISVECLPGATAFVPALVTSGLPCDKFHYEGFLPHKKGRQTRLKYLAQLPETIVLYESPHRIERCLNEIKEFFGENRQISFCREISKMFEEIKRGTVSEVINSMTPNSLKGEMVVVIAGYEEFRKTKYNSALES